MQGGGVPGDDGGGRGVDRRDEQLVFQPVGGQAGGDLGGGQRYRRHRAAPGQGGQGAGAQGGDFRGVGQRQRTGYVRGGDLALGVPGDGIRGDAVAAPHLRQRDHDREQGRLDDVGAVQGRGARHPGQHIGQ